MKPVAVLLAFTILLVLFCAKATQAAPCPAALTERLHHPVDEAEARPVAVACDLTFEPGEIVTAALDLSGSAASGAVVDCRGAVLRRPLRGNPTILIGSTRRADGSWDVPTGVRIRNCTIEGGIDIRGLGRNGEADLVRRSSLAPGHTERAQAAAPRDVILSNLTFVAQGEIPLYAAPGVTGLLVENSRFTGRSNSVAIYLDAESARNRITGNVFDIRTRSRELIAIDGSAENRIEQNRFENPVTGGIFLYRNCGEGGTIRHQAPQRNLIADNIFHYASSWARPAIWLGSRQGWRFYCLFRSHIPLGSSLSPYDYAQYNTVTGNRLIGGTPQLIRDDDKHNIVRDNF